jgi:ankyrin repeat protein
MYYLYLPSEDEHHACIRNSSLEMIRYLIEKCHLSAQVPNNQGWTALQWACIQDNVATVRYLVNYWWCKRSRHH